MANINAFNGTLRVQARSASETFFEGWGGDWDRNDVNVICNYATVGIR